MEHHNFEELGRLLIHDASRTGSMIEGLRKRLIAPVIINQSPSILF